MKNITTAQLRAARALLRWTAEDLAKKAGVSVATIRRAEPTDGELAMIPANAAAVRRALEEAGVIFVPENGEGPGVRLKKQRGEAT
jgi:transcriptional regulator with XRE-family HTH domain